MVSSRPESTLVRRICYRPFVGSNIGLTINILNANAVITYPMARVWVENKQKYFKISNVRQIYVADFAFYMGLVNKAAIANGMLALQNLQTAINEGGYGDQIKVTIPHTSAVLNMTMKPSEAEFRDEIKPEMGEFLRFMQKNNAPFCISINPITDVQDLGIDDHSFAIPNASNFSFKDNKLVYNNSFAVVYDAFVWALKKLDPSYSNIRIIVSQVGWPTDGYPGANTSTDERFFKGFLPWAMSNKGTPMRPGKPIDFYIHSITDENMTHIDNNDLSFMRHFGIYMSNGRPKYKVDLSGGGEDKFPAQVKGIMRMPRRWCILNGSRRNTTKLNELANTACITADCTATVEGGSCSHLDYSKNISYSSLIIRRVALRV